MKKIIILENRDVTFSKLRGEVAEGLLADGNKLYLMMPYGEELAYFEEKGCEVIDMPMDRRGINPIADIGLLLRLYRAIAKIKPDLVLSYTIKPNLYGGMVCRLLGIPQIPNITGLGTSIHDQGALRRLLVVMYRFALKQTHSMFFQNSDNRQFFIDNNIGGITHRMIPGSGVNVEKYAFEPYPPEGREVKFLFIGRIMKAKGIEELLEAAQLISRKHSHVRIDAVGFCEDEYKPRLEKIEKLGLIKFHGEQSDICEYVRDCHALILPSYHEGMSNALLEASSMGRPILTTDIPGCRETLDNGKSGILFKAKSADDLTRAMSEFIDLPFEQKKLMGLMGRHKMETEFDRRIVVDIYRNEIAGV